MKILIINGSRRVGNTDILIGSLEDKLRAYSKEVKILVLRDIEMKLPDGCPDCANGEVCPNISDQFSQEIEPAIRDYDVYIIASPVWNDGVTPLTKIFWDRIVSWCHESRRCLKDKKIGVVTHGMADEDSWQYVVDWVKSISIWEHAKFAGSFTCKSGAELRTIKINEDKLQEFVGHIMGQ